MSRLASGRRPPARVFPRERIQGLSNRQTFGAVDQRRDAGLYRGSTTVQLAQRITTPYIEQINPAHEQPKLIFYSGAQPFTNWGWRRFVRGYMSASPRFQGRWAAVGAIIRQYSERGRMTGVSTRQGTTYSYPQPRLTAGPRTIILGTPPV